MSGKDFNPIEVLPDNLIIKSAATHLYTSGLSLYPYEFVHRNKYYNPLFIFILNLQLFIRCIILSLLLSDENKYMLMIFGDFARFLNVRIHFNFGVSITILIALVSQVIHYYNYKNDVKPSYLKPFEMMSGLCSPKSIGLTNEPQVYKMINLSKKLFTLRDISCRIVIPYLGFIIPIVPLSLNYSLKQLIIFGIPYSLLWSYCLYHIYNIIISQLIYFHIVCFYLKCKIRSVNNMIIRSTTKKRLTKRLKIVEILKSFDLIYTEISEYNNNYWSKFLFVNWILLVIIISSALYLMIHIEANLIVRFIFIYATTLFICWLITIINTASSVNLEAKKSYTLLNSWVIHLNSRCVLNSLKIKVKGFHFYNSNLT